MNKYFVSFAGQQKEKSFIFSVTIEWSTVKSHTDIRNMEKELMKMYNCDTANIIFWRRFE